MWMGFFEGGLGVLLPRSGLAMLSLSQPMKPWLERKDALRSSLPLPTQSVHQRLLGRNQKHVWNSRGIEGGGLAVGDSPSLQPGGVELGSWASSRPPSTVYVWWSKLALKGSLCIFAKPTMGDCGRMSTRTPYTERLVL